MDSISLYPRQNDIVWNRVFVDVDNMVPLYGNALMPGVSDYSWDVNHDIQFDLPDGHTCIRATTEPFGAISLKTQSPFSGMQSLEFSIWLTIFATSQFVPEVSAFSNSTYGEYPNPIDDFNEWSSSIAIRFDASVPQADQAASGGMYLSFPLSEITTLEGGTWQRIRIPLGNTDPEYAWDRVSFMDTTGKGLSFFLDDIVLMMN